jgi:diketogulonate reductase-like aldo/keto reductase
MIEDLNIDSQVTLNNGIQIHRLGLGTYLASDGGEAKSAVMHALEVGYRHIDTAMMYENERDIGSAIYESGLPREEIFLATKLWNSDHGYQKAIDAFMRSLERLQLDYIDLYLIHWPVPELRKQSWEALEKLYADGLCRSIGVSNYMIHHLQEVLEQSDTVPMVNQVEFSPYLYLRDLHYFCNKNGIQLESYSPLTKGQMLNDPKLHKIADHYNKSPAQILIRWVLEKNIIVIPKSSNRGRIHENSQVYDFTLSDDDTRLLDSLHRGLHTSWDPTSAP